MVAGENSRPPALNDNLGNQGITGCRESQFYSLPFGKLYLARTSPQVISTSPKTFLISTTDYNPSVIWISQKNSICPSGKSRTKITSPIAKSTSPGLSDTTFFAHCIIKIKVQKWDPEKEVKEVDPILLWYNYNTWYRCPWRRICFITLIGLVLSIQSLAQINYAMLCYSCMSM